MNQSVEIIKQTLTNVLAIAISTLFPKAQLVSGEITEIGFFYDFNINEPLTPSQLSIIEERMHDVMRQDLPIKEMEMMRKNAMELFKYHKQDLKVALLKESTEDFVKVCQIGEYYDLCEREMAESTKKQGAFKLIGLKTYKKSLPGRPNLTLTRLSGVAFPDSFALKNFLKVMETAKQLDHRAIVKDNGLLEEVSPGSWVWLPKASFLRDLLFNWVKKSCLDRGFHSVFTQNYLKDASFQHATIFKSKAMISNGMPVGLFEINQFYSDGKDEDEYGLLKARGYSADTSTVFCDLDQLDQELISSLQFIKKVVNIFGFEAHWALVTKSQKVQSTSRSWKEAEKHLINAMKASDIDYTLDNDEKNYSGPTVEMRVLDALRRPWTCSYISLDVYHPKELGLHYQSKDKQNLVPWMISQSMIGSIERWVALLIENSCIPAKSQNKEFEKFLEQLKVKIGLDLF